jgi:hypothetical protein
MYDKEHDRPISDSKSIICLKGRIGPRNGGPKYNVKPTFVPGHCDVAYLLESFVQYLQHPAQSAVRNDSFIYSNIIKTVMAALQQQQKRTNKSSKSKRSKALISKLYPALDLICESLQAGLNPTVGNTHPILEDDWNTFQQWLSVAEFPIFQSAYIRGTRFSSFGDKHKHFAEKNLREVWHYKESYSSWACVGMYDFDSKCYSRSFNDTFSMYGQFTYFFRVSCDIDSLLHNTPMGLFLNYSTSPHREIGVPEHVFKSKVVENVELLGNQEHEQSDIRTADEKTLKDFLTHIRVAGDGDDVSHVSVVRLDQVYPSPLLVLPVWKKNMVFPTTSRSNNYGDQNLTSVFIDNAYPYLLSGSKLDKIGTDAKNARNFANIHMKNNGCEGTQNISYLTLVDLTPQNDDLLNVVSDRRLLHQSQWDM